ncbi:MAG: hypothetical protein IKI63_04390 [Clostridia bacterium]|nr:hypothetical protein [Clostridia bacterium]
MNDLQYTPEIEQPVAAVVGSGETKNSPLTEPKPAHGDTNGRGCEPPQTKQQPTRPDSLLAVGPVPTETQRRLLRQMGRTSAVWLITIPGAIVCLMLACFDLCETSREIAQTAATFLIVLALCVGWIILMKCLRVKPAAPPPLWNEVRINELHPQGAVSRGESGTLVLPYDEVLFYEETADTLSLCGRGGAIVWSANDLTPADASALQLYLRSKVPPGALRVRGAFWARCTVPLPLPSLPERAACHATAVSETNPRKLAVLRLGQALVRCTPLIWLLAMSAGMLVCGLVDFGDSLLGSPWVWFVGLSALLAAALLGLLWWDAALGKTRPYSTPEFSFCEDGLWMTAGRGEVRFPRGSVPAIRLRNALELQLPSGAVRLPYDAMSDRECIFRYFDLSA